MSRYLARIMFVTALFILKKRIAMNMWASPEYYCRTMFLIAEIYEPADAFKWQTRANNLMLSYKEEFHAKNK